MIVLYIANLSVEEKMKLAKLILSAFAILFASLSVVPRLLPRKRSILGFAFRGPVTPCMK